MLDTEEGIIKLIRDVHCKHKVAPKYETEVGITSDLRFVHLINAAKPIETTLLGMLITARDDDSKALFPIAVTFVGK
jgi:hypothetical protein